MDEDGIWTTGKGSSYTLGRLPQEAMKKIDRDKAKAAEATKEVEWRRESNDDLIEREFEDSIELVVGILILHHLR